VSPRAARNKFALGLPEADDDYAGNEEMKQFQLEHLPGSVKSKWALKYKLDRSAAIEQSLEFKGRVFDKRKTKGMFQEETSTNAGNWIRDRRWQHKANSLYQSLEVRRAQIDQDLLSKKKE